MASGVRINNWVQGVIKCAEESSERIITFNWYCTEGNPNSSQLDTLAASFRANCESQLRTALSNQVRLVEVTMRSLVPGGNALGTSLYAPNLFGLRGTDPQAGNVAAVASWRTGHVGRSYRGRTYMFGLSEGDTYGSTLNNAYLLDYLNFLSYVVNWAGTGSIGMTLVVASRTLETLSTITAVNVDNYIDSQRRRLINRGR